MKPRKAWHPLAFVGPTLAVLAVFFLFPLGSAIYESTHRWDLLTERQYVGLDHYAELWSSGELWGLFARTFSFAAIVVVLSMAIGLGLALALNREGRLYAFFRGAVFSAYVVSWVAVALLWMWLLDGDAGLVSAIVRGLGLPARSWLGDPSTALIALAAVTVWKIAGYSMVIFLAGLQDIPPSLHEAAALDGAGPVRRFWHVTLPLLRPTLAFVSTTSLILSFQAFDVIRVMTQGGPIKSTTLFVYAVYEHVFINLRVGRASATIVVFFVLLLVMTALSLWAFRTRTRYA